MNRITVVSVILNLGAFTYFVICRAFRGGIHTPPPEISRSTSATDLKFGPMVHLHKRAKMPPVLIRPPACDVFYRPETKKANLGIVIDLTDQC